MQGKCTTITGARDCKTPMFQLSGDCINYVIAVLSVLRYFRSVASSVIAVLRVYAVSASKMSTSMMISSDIETINDDDRK